MKFKKEKKSFLLRAIFPRCGIRNVEKLKTRVMQRGGKIITSHVEECHYYDARRGGGRSVVEVVLDPEEEKKEREWSCVASDGNNANYPDRSPVAVITESTQRGRR